MAQSRNACASRCRRCAITYFNAYDLLCDNCEHLFGTFTSGDHTLAGHIFIPAEPRATVLLMHGYFDHTGTLSQTIHHLIARGYQVAAYDMPGHGLSSGDSLPAR